MPTPNLPKPAHLTPLLILMKNRPNRRKHKINNSKMKVSCKKVRRKLHINTIQIQRRLKYVATSSGINHLPQKNINKKKFNYKLGSRFLVNDYNSH